MPEKEYLQKKYASQSICFGCGPANPQGLHIKSYVDGDRVVAHFTPKEHHHAFPGVLNGGIIGTLLDCHCNWASCYYLMKHQNADTPPCTVTAEYTIKLRRPTPVAAELTLIAELIAIDGNKVHIKGEIIADKKVCALCDATFVAVPPDHPAYHRW